NPRGVARRGVAPQQIVADSLGCRRGRRPASVEAGPPVVHHEIERRGGIQVIDEDRRLARKALLTLLATVIYVSIASIMGRTPMADVIRALANLSTVMIQTESIETEVPSASCLGAAH
ncbi:hypothetical protein FRC11_001724, partial [Ceratobasidium sp. 423]